MIKNKQLKQFRHKKKPLRRLTSIIQNNKKFKGHIPTSNSYFAIKSLGYGVLTSKQIENCRVFLRRASGKKQKKILKETRILIRSYVNKFFTKKSSRQRMGKGKGSVKGNFSTVYPGKVLFEARTGKKLDFLKAYKNIKDRVSFPVGLYCKKSSNFFYRHK